MPVVLIDKRVKQSLGAKGQQKFDFTKEYLASLVFGDLQQVQAALRNNGTLEAEQFDSLRPIREFFNEFFPPMEFVEVCIDCSPFKFVIRTPRGDIDIDDMSAGEKEVLNTFIRFHQLHPNDAVILFDEADAHLHPDLERRYLEVLRDVGKGNQVLLTTHSPEMMIEAGSDSLFTILKEPAVAGGNQFLQVTTSEQLHTSLSELMGSRGLVSFNQRIIFIEGNDSSADRMIYEGLYPPGVYNLSFVPVGNSGAVRSTAERVNDLLTSGIGFQHFFSIVDGDIDRLVDDPNNGRLFKLPVYHVENFLLDEQLLYDATRELLAHNCPYEGPEDLVSDLQNLLFEESHLKPFTKARLDASLGALAKQAYDAVYSSAKTSAEHIERPDFESVKSETREFLQGAIKDGSWRCKCKGRDLLRAFCRKNGINYTHLRNMIIGRMDPPPQLDEIIRTILES